MGGRVGGWVGGCAGGRGGRAGGRVLGRRRVGSRQHAAPAAPCSGSSSGPRQGPGRRATHVLALLVVPHHARRHQVLEQQHRRHAAAQLRGELLDQSQLGHVCCALHGRDVACRGVWVVRGCVWVCVGVCGCVWVCVCGWVWVVGGWLGVVLLAMEVEVTWRPRGPPGAGAAACRRRRAAGGPAAGAPLGRPMFMGRPASSVLSSSIACVASSSVRSSTNA